LKTCCTKTTFTSSKDQLVGIFTKPLSQPLFKDCRRNLNLLNIHSTANIHNTAKIEGCEEGWLEFVSNLTIKFYTDALTTVVAGADDPRTPQLHAIGTRTEPASNLRLLARQPTTHEWRKLLPGELCDWNSSEK
jgi:hypothetical protein